MFVKYSNVGGSLEDMAMVKKLLDTVPDRFLPVIAGIEQFCNIETMPFEEALSRLKAYEERTRSRAPNSGICVNDQLLLTQADWEARKKKGFGGGSCDNSHIRCFNCNEIGHYSMQCKAPKEEAHLARVDDIEPALLLVVFEEIPRQEIGLRQLGNLFSRQARQSQQELVLLREDKVLQELHQAEHGTSSAAI